MTAILAFTALAIAAAATWLIARSWRQQSIIAGLCGLATLTLVVLALASGLDGHSAELFGALAGLAIGAVSYALGQLVGRLLEDRCDETA